MTTSCARAALLVCPASGLGRAARMAGTAAEALRGAVGKLDPLVADSAKGTAELAAAAVRDGVDVLVVLGGDGGVHHALQACAGSDTALAVVPAGTGNDFAAALGLPADPMAALSSVVGALRDGRRRRVDLGRISRATWFGTVLCAGFDSAVNERANAMSWPRGPRRYDIAIVRELARLRPQPLVLGTDEGKAELEATLVAVGNTTSYGGGIPICPDAETADGYLDVTVVREMSRRELVRMLPTLRTGRHVEHPAVTTLRARRVLLGGDNDWIAYADGERQTVLPITVECVPAALTVVTPA
ncbi:diacylglycerol/lipid kinase family protein [Gandjariella thermophila]|uniref:Sphingosine kinase n=1 Tax=Gandjariella thermophila TaxID=1931992 RepID=A0A4D4J221_9PSEU|nr:YegS/Rv2252/BmrU family lipid kinase [Gandjariella thermophila]GDY28576.1 sphingosine kinase [Gandjariella thermophila]